MFRSVKQWRFFLPYIWEIDMNSDTIYNLKELKELVANLGNLINNQAMSQPIFKEETMAKEDRRVIICWEDDGTPIYKRVKGFTQDEVNDKIVKTYIESGRIWEFLSKPEEKQTPCLETYSGQWIDRKRKIKQTTKANYQKYLKLINAKIGNKKLGDVTVSDIQSLLDSYSGLSHKTLKDMKGILHQIFRYAISDGFITKNPCDSVDIEIPSDKKSVREALPIAQFKDILSNLENLSPMDRRYLALIMYTGMRRGEALGLKWEDIDFKNKQIHICRSVTHPQQNIPVISSPKTKAGIRTIPLDSNLEIFLVGNFEKTNQLSGYIIGGEKPLTLSGFRSMMKRITDTIDMHGATAHILRHSYLTYAVGETSDFKTIQGISGHADLNTLINRYAHPQEDKIQALANKMHDRLECH